LNYIHGRQKEEKERVSEREIERDRERERETEFFLTIYYDGARTFILAPKTDSTEAMLECEIRTNY